MQKKKSMKKPTAKTAAKKLAIATFGAGCFWGVQGIFDEVPGVVETTVGYMGGDEKKHPNLTYGLVCSHTTNYAEVVQVVFDEMRVSYEKLLDVFWSSHDPTTMNRQGSDVGSQYRSAVFYSNDAQKKAALAAKARLQKMMGEKRKVVTEITKAGTFFRAEEYHQKYLEKNGLKSCHI